MNVKVITFFNNSNFGSELQAYAMQLFLKENGYCDVKFIKKGYKSKLFKGLNLVSKKLGAIFQPKDIKFLISEKSKYTVEHEKISPETRYAISCFSKKHLDSHFCNSISMKQDKNSVFICGSDQIWSPLIIPILKENFLAYVPTDRKIAYAPSFGINEVPKSFKTNITPYLRSFKYIGMREEGAAELVGELIQKTVPVLADPVFLVQSKVWFDLAQKGESIKDQYVFCYFLDEPLPETIEYVKKISQEKKVKYVCYKSYFSNCENAEFLDVGPEEFLALIKNASVVITDSFHGTAFSAIFEKDVRVFSRNHPKALHQSGRIVSLFNNFCIDRKIDCYDEKVDDIDYKKVSEKKEEMAIKSRAFLLDALKNATSM